MMLRHYRRKLPSFQVCPHAVGLGLPVEELPKVTSVPREIRT